ncbi:MAG TPA: sigma-70 family RNA polymerase sigma factor [Anaeromyxobacteraceae bacterium]|nr:sigma-70 family RNA polymerase sigma factor [Anaeromyxobacteraceae bacterium]
MKPARSQIEPPAPPAAADERALVERLRKGDRAAFAALVARHGGALLRLASTLVRQRALAEEVVQETWLAALEGLDRFEGRSSLRTWLFHILANRARTRAVREGRSVPFSALGDPADDEPAVDPDRFTQGGGWREPPGGWGAEDPERLALGAETRAVIEAAIAALPESQRAVITLRDVEGLEAEEICALLGVTVTNQRVLLHRARARVRRALEEHLEAAPAGRGA